MANYTEQGKKLMYDMANGVEYVDAYCRYSSHMQDDGNSIEYQMEEIEAYCQRNGLVIRKWYVDKAKSAQKVAGREAFYELIDDIKHEIAAPNLIVWRTNRIFRNSYESHKYRKYLRDNGIKLLSVTQTIDEETSAGRLTTNILSDIDQYKVEEMSEHITAALRSMVKKGYWTGQSVPLGYKVVPAMDGDKPRKAFAIDEETAPIVRRIFDDFLKGLPPAYILEWLRNEGVKTQKGNTYDYNTLYRLLKNEFYAGTRKYNTRGRGAEPLIVPNSVPAIISKEQFDEVQNIFLSRRRAEPVKGRRSNRNRMYYLTGKIFCAKCGDSYLGKTCNGVAYYYCKNRLRRKECDGVSIQKKHLEPAVFKAIRENIFTSEAMDEIVKLTLEKIAENPIKTKTPKEELEKRKKVLVREIAELTQMYLDKLINQEVFITMKKSKDDELAEIEIELLAAEQEQKTVIDETFIRSYLSDLFDKSESGNEELLKYLVDNVVEKVIVGGDKVEIYLALNFAKTTHKQASAFPDWRLCVNLTRAAVTSRTSKNL